MASRRTEKNLIIALLILVFCWTLPLSVSPKQTFRYVMPVVPLMYLIASWGWYRFFAWVILVLRSNRMILRRRCEPSYVLSACIFSFVAIQGTIDVKWAPDFNLFFNTPSGGFGAAMRRGRSMPIAGVNEAIEFLNEQQPWVSGDRLMVRVAGDLEAVRYAYRRHPLHAQGKLKFIPPLGASDSDYLLLFPQFTDRFLKHSDLPLLENKAAFAYSIQGENALQVFAIPPWNFTEPEFFEADESPRQTGREVKADDLSVKGDLEELQARYQNFSLHEVILLLGGKDSRGHFLFGEYPRVAPGEFEARYYLALPPEYQDETLDASRLVARIEFGRCKRGLRKMEFSSGKVAPFSLRCSWDRQVRPQLRAYWFGNVSLVYAGVEVERLNDMSAE